MRQSHADVKMLPEFKSDEDAEFVKTLFEKTLINYNERLEYIEKFTRNWDVERIVFMDNLIMATAITELVSFPSIPVKVTLDEYIDIAKFYSTPGSSTFINGVLDKIVEGADRRGKNSKNRTGTDMMRHIFCILLITLVIGCQSRRTSSVQSGPTLEISDETLTEGTSDTIRFGRAPLRRKQASNGSGCKILRPGHGWWPATRFRANVSPRNSTDGP